MEVVVSLRLVWVAFLFCLSTHAHSVTLYMPDAPPLTLVNRPQGHGIVGDVVVAAIARAGFPVQVRVDPWPRAQHNVITGRNLLITPLSRTPEREALYTWIAPIMRLQRAFFTLDAPATSFVEARSRYHRIGIGLGTAQEETLLQNGVESSRIVRLKLGERPVQMLEKGRIDAWFTGIEEGTYLWARESKQPVQMSPPLHSTDLYLACSRHCDDELVTRLRTAVQALEADGTNLRIHQSYRPIIEPPSDHQ